VSVTLAYDPGLARVRVAVDALPAATVYVRVDRSVNGVQWTTVRGGDRLTPAAGAARVDDYEFAPGVATTWRARAYSAVDVVLGTQTAATTAAIDRVWLKSVARPYLNRSIVTQQYTPVQRKARAGVFDVPGRSFPVVVSDVAGSRQWTLSVLTSTPAEAHALEVMLASGDILHVQVPAGVDIPGGYVSVGDVELARVSRPLRDPRRLVSIPMTECAAPGPDVVGYTATWAGLLAAFGSWTAVLAAFPSWAAVLEYVAAPDTVIVP